MRLEETKQQLLARLRERALADERDGRSIVMRDPAIKPKPAPRKPSWDQD